MVKPDLRSGLAGIARAMEDAAAHYRNGRLDAAEKICARVLKAQPNWFDALHLLGLVKLESGKAAAALHPLEMAAKVNPRSPEVLCSIARTLAALNRDTEGLAAIDKALAFVPDHFEALHGRGNILLKLNRAEEALAVFERSVAIEPRFLGARASLGNAMAQLGRYEEALAHYDAVLAEHPLHAETHFNRANALAGLGRMADALAAYAQALSVRPDYVRAQIGRGVALQALNRHQEALEAFATVLRTDKNNVDARHNEALSLLTLGDYRRGFASYEARWARTGMKRARSLGVLWLGEYPLARKTILIHAEQGLGDTIQFARYVPELARKGARVVLEVQPELKALLSRLDGVASVIGQGEALPKYDVHCPAGSLPLALGTELTSIPAKVPYLRASEERLAKWRARIEPLPQPRIAVAWSGNPGHSNDRNRSISLAQFAPLFSEGQGSFVSIQRDLRDGDAATLAMLASVAHVGDALADFEDTAAVLELVDLVISVDTAVVHLAGAMGRPVWVLLPFQPDWRWLLDRDDSPWHPTARLFRQPQPGDWNSVIERMAAIVRGLRMPATWA